MDEDQSAFWQELQSRRQLLANDFPSGTFTRRTHNFLEEGKPQNDKFEKFREMAAKAIAKRQVSASEFNTWLSDAKVIDDPPKPKPKKDTLELLQELLDVL